MGVKNGSEKSMEYRMANRGRGLSILVLLFLVAWLMGCAAPRQEPPETPPEPQPIEPVKQFRAVTVPQENFRAQPQGEVLGQVSMGDSLVFEERRANWCRVVHEELGDGWIWAPSLGYEQVTPLSLRHWMGSPEDPVTEENLRELFGTPAEEEYLAGVAMKMRYLNPNEFPVYGRQGFERATAWIDMKSRQVVRVRFDMRPYEGDAGRMLAILGLPDKRSTRRDFEHIRYDDSFAGLARLEMRYYQGNFERIGSVTVDRFPPEDWKREVSLVSGSKKAVVRDGVLVLVMEAANGGELAWGAPMIEAGLYEGSRIVGEWTLGPAQLRLAPGERGVLEIPTPVQAAGLDLNRISALAELVDMLPLPPHSTEEVME